MSEAKTKILLVTEGLSPEVIEHITKSLTNTRKYDVEDVDETNLLMVNGGYIRRCLM